MNSTTRIGLACAVVIAAVVYLAISGIGDSKSYYVTISELQKLGNKAYTRHLRVAGNVQPGSVVRSGTHADFTLVELDKTIRVSYQGMEPLPDTFKDDAQALAMGTYGRDGVFHATQIQAKCASKYAPAQPGQKPTQQPATGAPSKAAAAVIPAR
ncbi:cytochrome c maturation protein CcmE [Terriglobus albidus]|uniref:Cytochrome c maturation protein CcmE n=1 Tax=Terriglobus albidus TaxID=1592106 RepID=A0A5B9EEL3_9BACT|nr:cytochrome c maturation protein CcmE [Terriglobus albidus]QEE28737.1 cytochrome c maturation protein CcmE [Terriglobus albidus]